MKSPLLKVDLGMAVAVNLGPAWVLLDCGEGAWAAWQARELPAQGPDAIAFSSGRPDRIAGLYGLLAGMAHAGRSAEVRLLHAVDDERVGNLASAWLQSERCPYPLTLEADWPGATLVVGGITLTSAADAGGLRWVLGGGARKLEYP